MGVGRRALLLQADKSNQQMAITRSTVIGRAARLLYLTWLL